ncbi:PREDICTED: uncharacterized protein LOC109172713 [Ipomoea nil]|uniref:uncharacterized protein LOC109172713 n=1 Tax=Ipomoea nil TaxID=35883 RepID=UPI000900D230|nr:PREDICTED: uncharacterized protein LOC109172713 [Ipomoea nil]XP_019177485.1 PREDICTED: uncharacterized protein LOC109172713 [Ipomoea nil]XP_019177486.1 PREDICTED: uncharacterized protein LOC109172713 [Ipomoea nil]XP_019177487.1 PREDICTED: uncharacterized protein LOC109172713 [Ipomoea nil]
MRWCFSRLGSQYLIRRRSEQVFRTGNLTRHFHTLRSSLSNSILSRTHSLIASNYTTSAPETKPIPSGAVLGIVDEISGLTLLEVSDLTEMLRKKMGVEEMPVMTMMMPGMGFSPGGLKGKGGAGAGSKAEEKAEKTVFDLKLEGGFDSGAKIKIIKEVRSFTDLGLKEAKELVEKAPAVLKKGVTKEEAEKIIEKMKGVGAKITME